MPAIPEFSHTELESICNVLADTSRGLTGSEMGSILARLGIPDPMPTITKRHRLFEALAKRQAQTRSGSVVGAFIQETMNPVRYTEKNYQIWYYCSVCRERINIEPNSDSYKAMIGYMKEHGWQRLLQGNDRLYEGAWLGARKLS